MTSREAYFKAYVYSTKPLGMLFYTFQQNGIERIGNTPWMEFQKEDHEYNIQQMEFVESHEGFLFWNISDEADKHREEKSRKMKVVLSALTFMQK